MDMSVKLNLSYPAPAPQSVPAPVNTVADHVDTKPDAKIQPAIEPKRADLEKAVSDIREFIQATQRTLDFSIDDSTHQVVVKVIATESGEVIRQIPSETALKLAQSLHDASSLLFDAKA